MKKTILAGFIAAFIMALIPMAKASAISSYNGTTISPVGNTYTIHANGGDTINLANVGGQACGIVTLVFNSSLETTVNGTITIVASSTKPADAGSNAVGILGTYYDVTLTGINQSDISGATWKFCVANSWLQQNGLSGSNIFLDHYTNGAWQRLSTTVTSTDATKTYYQAIVTGFSPFAVVGVTGLSNTGSPYMLGAILATGIIVVIGAAFILSRKRMNQ